MVSYYSSSQIPKCPIIKEEKMFDFSDDSILKIENDLKSKISYVSLQSNNLLGDNY